MHPDGEGLRRQATGLLLHADRTRLLAVRVRTVGTLRWRSLAADVFRDEVAARALALEAAAEETRALAAALDRLAGLLEQRSGCSGPPGLG